MCLSEDFKCRTTTYTFVRILRESQCGELFNNHPPPRTIELWVLLWKLDYGSSTHHAIDLCPALQFLVVDPGLEFRQRNDFMPPGQFGTSMPGRTLVAKEVGAVQASRGRSFSIVVITRVAQQ